MTEMEYNKAPGIRRSDLWKIEESPEKFRYAMDHPEEQTAAMVFGTAMHTLVLEPMRFNAEYAVAPSVDRRTKTGKAMWEAFAADNEGKTLLSQDDADVMAGMELAIENCRLANDLLRGEGESEQAYFWTDDFTGEKCKIRCDRVVRRDGKIFVVDYKTTKNADTRRFNTEIWTLGYYMQAAMYAEGVKAAMGLDYTPGFIFVAQEKKAPYAVNVIEVTDEVMTAGKEKFWTLLRRYQECREADLWPGYVDDVPNETYLPGWYESEMEEE